MYKAFLKEDSQLVGIYAAAKFCADAEKYDQAAGFSNVLVNKLARKYPPAYVSTAKYFRLSGNYEKARLIVSRADFMPEIQKEIQEEKELIEQEAKSKK